MVQRFSDDGDASAAAEHPRGKFHIFGNLEFRRKADLMGADRFHAEKFRPDGDIYQIRPGKGFISHHVFVPHVSGGRVRRFHGNLLMIFLMDTDGTHHHIGAGLLHGGKEVFQRIVLNPVVRVNECQIRGGGQLYAQITRGGNALVPLVDDFETRVPASVFIQNGSAAVRRSVIYTNSFPFFQGLAENGI